MNSAVQNLVVSLVAMQSKPRAQTPRSPLTPSPVARKIPFEDPVILTYVRIGYVSVQVIILATYYWVSLTVCPTRFCLNAPPYPPTGKTPKRPNRSQIWQVFFFIYGTSFFRPQLTPCLVEPTPPMVRTAYNDHGRL